MSGNSRFAVAIHILAVLGYLQKEGVELVASEQIAQSANTNPVVIRNLLRALKKFGLIFAKEGRGGGVRLARDPAKITLLEIYVAVEETGILTANKNPPYSSCPVSCGMQNAFAEVADEVDGAVTKILKGKTLKDVLRKL